MNDYYTAAATSAVFEEKDVLRLPDLGEFSSTLDQVHMLMVQPMVALETISPQQIT